eukprot:196691_1
MAGVHARMIVEKKKRRRLKELQSAREDEVKFSALVDDYYTHADTDGDGTLDRAELGRVIEDVFRELEKTPPDAKTQEEMFNHIDLNSDDRIDKE